MIQYKHSHDTKHRPVIKRIFPQIQNWILQCFFNTVNTTAILLRIAKHRTTESARFSVFHSSVCLELKQCLSVDMSWPCVSVDVDVGPDSRVNYFSQMPWSVLRGPDLLATQASSHTTEIHKIQKGDLRFYLRPHVIPGLHS